MIRARGSAAELLPHERFSPLANTRDDGAAASRAAFWGEAAMPASRLQSLSVNLSAANVGTRRTSEVDLWARTALGPCATYGDPCLAFSLGQHNLAPLDLIVAETSSDLAMWTNDPRNGENKLRPKLARQSSTLL
jgi:hypothetical protein